MAGGYITLSSSKSSDGATSVVVTITMTYYGNGVSYNNDTDVSQSITFNGSTQSFSHTFTTSTSAQTMGSKSWTVSKTHSSRSLTASGSMYTAVSLGTLTASTSVSIGAKTSYSITYAANGGTGAPSADTKWYGEAATVSSTKPTRTGYTFSSWSGSNSVSYQPGGTIAASVNQALTLTAQWAVCTKTFTFNANNGSGTAMSNQAITYASSGTTALTANTYTRTGYTFKNWNTAANGSGSTYTNKQAIERSGITSNSTIPLYAQWDIDTYTITYDANGGTGAPSGGTKTYGVTYVLSTTQPTRTNYTFDGWNTKADGSGTNYAAGGNYTTNANQVFYAKWKLAIVKPSITNLVVTRANSGGTVTPDGTYANISFNYTTDASTTGKTIVIQGKLKTASSYTTIVTISSGLSASGTITQNGKNLNGTAFATGSAYDILVTITDNLSQTYSTTSYLSPAFVTLDFKAGGTGIAMGVASTIDGFLEGMDMYTLQSGAPVAVITDGTATDQLLLSSSTISAWNTILGN